MTPNPLRQQTARADCPVCHGDGKTLMYGNGDFAELRSCSLCGTGERLADTIIPAVRMESDDGSA